MNSGSSTNNKLNRATICKAERLRSKNVISSLFEHGHSFVIHPVRTLWAPAETRSHFPLQAAFMVSAKNFPKAVDRNRIKRTMREAYRLNRSELYDFLKQQGLNCDLIFIYKGNKLIPYAEIETKIILSLKRLIKHHEDSC